MMEAATVEEMVRIFVCIRLSSESSWAFIIRIASFFMLFVLPGLLLARES